MEKAAMKWTRQKPTVAGWYWHNKTGRTGADSVVLFVGPYSADNPTLYAYGWGTDYNETPLSDGEWAGPILLPEDSQP